MNIITPTKYKKQFLELQSYVANVPDEHLNVRSETLTKFDKPEQQKILAIVINNIQRNKLNSCSLKFAQDGWKGTFNKLDSLQQLIE